MRPHPPTDSEEASHYEAGDAVYYFRSGWCTGRIQPTDDFLMADNETCLSVA